MAQRGVMGVGRQLLSQLPRRGLGGSEVIGVAARAVAARGTTLQLGSGRHLHSSPVRCCSECHAEEHRYHHRDEPQGPFTSKHYSPSDNEVVDLFKRKKVEFREAASGDTLEVKLCPFCHPIKGKRDNMYKLNVFKDTGGFHCFRCNTKGGWWKLRTKLMGQSSVGVITPVSEYFGTETTETKPLPAEEVQRYRQLYEESPMLQKYMIEERGLSKEVIDMYGVGGKQLRMATNGQFADKLCLMFPMSDQDGKTVRYKARAYDSKNAQAMYPKGGSWGLFGLDTVPEDAEEIILTEGEFDAMAAYQGTGIPAVSLPNGASSLPISVLPLLERFSKVYLWMDDDHAGREGVKVFAKKLGLRRTFIVRSRGGEDVGPKDANDVLREGGDMKTLVDNAAQSKNQSIVSFYDLMGEVYEELRNPKKLSGTQWQSMKGLSSILKGHRRGEFTIYSGHTGVGKTTLAGQISLDLCMQGVRTLWGSFEVSNTRMAKMLLGQFHFLKTGRYLRPSDVASLDSFREMAAEFEALPLYFMKFYGSCPVPKIIETMEHAHYVLDTSHVVLDNLSFMLSGQSRGFNKFDIQDDAVSEFRKFATKNNSHISLVMHPRKENDQELLQTSSISGTAKATQEADNIILLQRGEKYIFVEVRKNRYDGGLGRVPVVFDTDSKLFTELGQDSLKFCDRSFSKVNKMDRAKPRPAWLPSNTATPVDSGVQGRQAQNEVLASTELDNLVHLSQQQAMATSVGRAAQSRSRKWPKVLSPVDAE